MYIILDVIITNILDEVNILGFDPCTESIASQSIGDGIYYERWGVNKICIMIKKYRRNDQVLEKWQLL